MVDDETGTGSRLSDTFADVARNLAEPQGLEPTLQRIVDLARQTIPGTRHAGITRVRGRRRVDTIAATEDVPSRIDAIQYETGQGPCLDAIWKQDVVQVDDLSETDRWPDFAGRAVELGILSMLSFRLFVEEDTSGALNLYSDTRRTFDDESVRLGRVFAAHAALAWDHEKELSDLRTTIESRTVIGQAQGILMAQRGVSADEAFDLLVSASQHRNVKLREVAREVADSGELRGSG